jgi:hypothetical protein
MNQNAVIRVTVTPPMNRAREGENPREYAFTIDEHLWQEAFGALPRNREIDPREYRRAIDQQRRREHLAYMVSRALASKIAEQLLQWVTDGDTINGYTPEQWAKMRSK